MTPDSAQLLGTGNVCVMPASQQVGSALQQEALVVNGTVVKLLLRRTALCDSLAGGCRGLADSSFA